MFISRVTKLFLIMAILMFVGVPVGMAQETDDLEFAYGKVSKVSDDKIVLSVYDYEADAEVEVTYYVNAETVLDGVASIKDLNAGDEIDIEYVVVGGKNIVKNLYKAIGDEAEGMEEVEEQ